MWSAAKQLSCTSDTLLIKILKSDGKHDCNSSLEINHGIKLQVFPVHAMNECAEYRNVKTQVFGHSKLQRCQIKRIFYCHKLILRVLIFSF